MTQESIRSNNKEKQKGAAMWLIRPFAISFPSILVSPAAFPSFLHRTLVKSYTMAGRRTMEDAHSVILLINAVTYPLNSHVKFVIVL